MQTQAAKSATEPAAPGTPQIDIAVASVAETLARLHVNPETGLIAAAVTAGRQASGCNEVAERKRHPFLRFLAKFWGISAWMLELIMILSVGLFSYALVACLLANDALKVAMNTWRTGAATVTKIQQA